MQDFPNLEFRFTWRPYQERVLAALEEHLGDKKLHIVAAPGAGKTTLGIEVFRKLGKRALILSPTRIIRDQWIDRLGDFCNSSEDLTWTSRSLNELAVFNSVTYQALYSLLKAGVDREDSSKIQLNEKALKDVVDLLNEHKIQTLILDEAHHLRSEWWRILNEILQVKDDMTLVSLTGTPPYDSKGSEWLKYESLCGPIDEEISIPELVKAGTLCPHQDFVWACDATESEGEKVQSYDRCVEDLCQKLYKDNQFDELLKSHKVFDGEYDWDELYRVPEELIAILVLLKSKDRDLDPRILSALDLKKILVPQLGRKWWQILIQTVLFSKYLTPSASLDNYRKELKKLLRSLKLLHRNTLSIESSREVKRSLSLSSAKIEGICQIHECEFDKRGQSLRQVILTDFIRDEQVSNTEKIGEYSLGALPVFKTLKMTSSIPDDLALVCGRFNLVHVTKVDFINTNFALSADDYKKSSVDPHYLELRIPVQKATQVYTKLLMLGQIKVLIGTRSLLGEGWDAPVINSLILASSVGSFMQTNQMRGRAIRRDPHDPDKISSIWHLVAINPKSYSGWLDYFDLQGRFKTFPGLHTKDLRIETGFERLGTFTLNHATGLKESWNLKLNNRKMRQGIETIEEQGERWHQALDSKESIRIVPSLRVFKQPNVRQYHLRYSLTYLLSQLTGAFWALYESRFLVERGVGFRGFLVLVVIGTLLWKLPQSLKLLKILFSHLPVDGSLKSIGKALSESLSKEGFIKTPLLEQEISINSRVDGSFTMALKGCSFYESSLFADALAEVFSCVENPRYLISRKAKFLSFNRVDYHVVPLKLASQKKLAMSFLASWEKYLGPSELIYTRSSEGKEKLIKAKTKAFSSNFRKEVERQDLWQ
ncbi:DEAD/DEAH box helicase family protein [Lentisphaera profundi]|uniref:DEAD/DEAH box helicase family protein n=1 Tax=Lentisphaera profundi TaxID=1658616 RepID=A0ABY7VZ23_9BACT|nr:DEAD/DEAH box helicase family protein [Lentisphaera profundi]WDE99034.1 DEAD/DEAH box helicase family protein [Lentisphaera profundi]